MKPLLFISQADLGSAVEQGGAAFEDGVLTLRKADVTLLSIEREAFAEILAEKPAISRGIIEVLTGRLREANRK